MKKKPKLSSSSRKPSWETEIEQFLSTPLAQRASAGLSDRISVAMHLEEQDFFFSRKNGQNALSREEEIPPDIHFWVREGTMRHLLGLAQDSQTGVGTMGIAIFEHIFTKDEERKIRFRVDAGFLGLWSKGYFSVLKAGGPEVASYLARFGYQGLNAIKEVLKTIRT